jgi:D-amino-acid dehydrogenase
MRIVVLGAGVVGTASAWYLARAGHAVTVVDRQAGAALETSFANGGQVSVSHSEPWANPAAPLKILGWLGREDAPLLFRLRADPHQWAWGLRFLFECLPGRTRANTRQILALALHSRACLQALRAETGLRYDAETRGILQFFTERADWDHARRTVDEYRERGLDVVALDADACIAREPALADARAKLAGGTYTASDESGDAHKFTRELAARCERAGAVFRYDTRVEGIDVARGRVAAVRVRAADGTAEALSADAFVVALGSWSAPLLRTIGVRLPVYPAKGYSITVPLAPDAVAPRTSLTDEAHKLVFSRLGERLRVAGTAELNGYDTSLNPVRWQAIVARVFDLFPRLGRREDAQPWTGLRPATPSNRPFVGRSSISNLYLNTGHGTLGWTLACGSGDALATIVDGRRPAIDFPFAGLA